MAELMDYKNALNGLGAPAKSPSKKVVKMLGSPRKMAKPVNAGKGAGK